MIEIRASELGSCIKAQVAKHLGHKPLPTPDAIQAAYDRGNEHEEANAHALSVNGWTIIAQQREVVLDLGAAQVTGHLDGILGLTDSDITPDRVWESKSPAAWSKFERAYKTGDWSDPLAHRYAWQISVYMIATGLEAMVTCLDGEQVRSFVIEVPPFTWADIEHRTAQIAEFAEHGVLPQVCSSNDYPCPFAYLHETPDVDVDPELDRAAQDYALAGRMVKEWTAKQKRAQEKVREVMGDREKVTTDQFTVSVYTQQNPGKYDKQAMLDDGVLHRYFKEGSVSERMKITERGETDASEA